jgi:hypothetical protein
MPGAGALRHRIAFDSLESVDDSYGNTEGSFVEQFVVWAPLRRASAARG